MPVLVIIGSFKNLRRICWRFFWPSRSSSTDPTSPKISSDRSLILFSKIWRKAQKELSITYWKLFFVDHYYLVLHVDFTFILFLQKCYGSVKELPFLSSFLMDVVWNKVSICSVFLEEWKESISRPHSPAASNLAAQASLVRLAAKTSRNNSQK